MKKNKGEASGVPSTQGGPLSKKVVAAYAGLALPTAALGLPIAVYLPPFYANEGGLGLVMVGIIFTIARLWDVVTDPIMGVVIDRYPTRWGRRRHWIVMAMPILLLSGWFLYMPSPGDHSPAYLLGWLVVLYVGYTFLTIAHQSWGADLAQDYSERSRLYGWREIMSIGGMTAVLALPALMERSDVHEAANKVASMGWYLLILLPIMTWVIVKNVPEYPAAKVAHVPFKKAFSAMFQYPSLGRLLVADLAIAFGKGIGASSYIFLATWVFELSSYASLILLTYFLSGLVAMPIWMKLAYKIGKHQTLIGGMLYAGVALLLFLLVAEPGSLYGLLIVTVIYGSAFGVGPMILRAMIADLSDLDELETGHKRSGLFFALLTTTNKVGAALSVSVSYALLSWVDFDPSAKTNTALSIDSLLSIFVFVPLVFFAIAAIALFRYPLDKNRHDEVRQQLAERLVDGCDP